MRPVNLFSISIADKCLTPDNQKRLFNVWGITPKPRELVSLNLFVKALIDLLPQKTDTIAEILGDCYFGFVIPRISKEFDCLWIGDKTVVDVELKSQSVGSKTIKKQLMQNQQYLRPLGRTIQLFSFDSSSGDCFTINENYCLVNCTLNNIGKAIFSVHKENRFVDDIEKLFPPEKYLVSPFNATTEFLNKQYFLTSQQEDIKKKILSFVEETNDNHFCALTGGPGSGKSLLLYDIAQTLMDAGKNVIIAHSGLLNDGHNQLIGEGWQIVPSKKLITGDLKEGRDILDADVYLFDETQRCYGYILEIVIKKAVEKRRKCIFSLDAEQIMSNEEQRSKNDEKIKAIITSHYYELTSNIRTNASIYGFVRALFDKHHSTNTFSQEHIEITYCPTINEAITMLKVMGEKGYLVPRFTPQLYKSTDYESWFPNDVPSAHEVIGQEFDDVVGLISDKLFYDDNGILKSRGKYFYREDKMLYQILSRARNRIHLVIVNNPIILERVLKLLGN